MSWDIVLFNSKQKITDVESLDETLLEATDFCSILESHFPQIIHSENHREIVGKDFSIEYFIDTEPVSNKVFSLYGENGLFELAVLAQKKGWQLFDTGINQMIDLDNPSNNGYAAFQDYLKFVLNKKG